MGNLIRLNLHNTGHFGQTTARHSSYKNKVSKNPSLRREVSFGLNYSRFAKIFGSVSEEIPKQYHKAALDAISTFSKKQGEFYSNVIKDFTKHVKDNEDFQRRFKISPQIVEEIDITQLYTLPKASVLKRFVTSALSPITSLRKLYIPIFDNSFGKRIAPKLYNYIQKNKAYDELAAKYRSFEGICDSVRIWESKLRKDLKYTPQNGNEKLIIPQDILVDKIIRRRLKSVNPDKGQYSTKHVALGTRFVTGSIYAYYLSNDSYNITMRLSGNKEEAGRERNLRAAQEGSRIVFNLGLQQILMGTFEKFNNKSIINALLISGATVALSEIFGRMLVGKPFTPSNKEQLDKMEKDFRQKEGILARLGRFMAGLKSSDKKPKNEIHPFSYNKNIFAPKTQLILTKPEDLKNSFTAAPSFGSKKIIKTLAAKELEGFMNVLQKCDEVQYNFFRSKILSYFKKLKEFNGHNLNSMSFEDAIKTMDKIPVGESESLVHKTLDSIFLITKIKKLIKKITNKHSATSFEQIKEKSLLHAFEEYKREKLKTSLWKNSGLSSAQKEERLAKDFLDSKEKENEEINGVKNMLLWCQKFCKSKKINLANLKDEDIKKLQAKLSSIMLKSDASKEVEYDANFLAQLNMHFSRLITTIFLVVDSYNLTMQYSNNKDSALGQAGSRAAQEGSRIGVGAYMMSIFHTMFKQIYNSTLAGALSVTAFTATFNDALARWVIGIPITPKNREQLVKMDEENSKSKNPAKKFLAGLIGKRQKTTLSPRSADASVDLQSSFIKEIYAQNPIVSEFKFKA